MELTVGESFAIGYPDKSSQPYAFVDSSALETSFMRSACSVFLGPRVVVYKATEKAAKDRMTVTVLKTKSQLSLALNTPPTCSLPCPATGEVRFEEMPCAI